MGTMINDSVPAWEREPRQPARANRERRKLYIRFTSSGPGMELMVAQESIEKKFTHEHAWNHPKHDSLRLRTAESDLD
jgi:hypothetical protein